MRVTKAFYFGDFCKVASMAEDDFAKYGDKIVKNDGKAEGETSYFADNGSNVLGIAHLDTVQGSSRASLLKLKGERVIVCPKLDDRLGVYIITHMLPKLGIECDWLLTTGEEIGRSSAEHFKTEKKYNWAFSFDRAGTDAVLYQFDHKALRKALRPYGFIIGNGSFSDLSFLDIGCSGVNFGCGYHDAHGIHAYCILSELFVQVGRFRQFWRDWHDKVLPYDPYTSRTEYRSWAYWPHNGYVNTQRDWYEVPSEIDVCLYCGASINKYAVMSTDGWICDDCITDEMEWNRNHNVVSGASEERCHQCNHIAVKGSRIWTSDGWICDDCAYSNQAADLGIRSHSDNGK